MNNEITVTGKTVEEAVEKAVEQLGAPSVEAVTYTIVEEPKKGFLGIGSVMAKITASYNCGGESVAFEFIKRILSDMKLNAEAVMKDGTNDDKLIDITGADAGILIGHHGDTLDALQYLANLAANKRENGEKHDFVKMTIDIEGYRARREETLRVLARRSADKVLRYKKSVVLDPMTPYERRIIHSEVQNIAGVSTNSIGSENNRKVVIYLDDGTKSPKNNQQNKSDDEE